VGATAGIGAFVAVGFGVAVGKVIPKDLNEPVGVGAGDRGAEATGVAAEGADAVDAPNAAGSAPASEPPPQAEAATATAVDTKIRVVLTALVMSSSFLKMTWRAWDHKPLDTRSFQMPLAAQAL